MESSGVLSQLLFHLIALWPLTLAMVALFVTGLVQLQGIYKNYRSEVSTIEDCGQHLAKGASGFASRTEVEERVSRWLKDLKETSLARRVIAHVFSMRRLQNPDVGAVTSLIAQASAASLNNLRGLPNLLFIAGLLGTVWGLALSVGSLSEPLAASLDRPNPAALTEKLSITLGEMQGAFAFTLLGVLFSGIVSFFIARTQGDQAYLSSTAQDFALKLAGYMFPSSQAAQLEDMQRILLESRDFMNRVTELMGNASAQFEKVLNTASQQMSDHIRHLNDVSQAVVKTLQDATDDVRKSTTAVRKGAEELHKGVERLGTGVESLRQYQDDLRDTYSNLQQMFQESQQSLQDFSKEQAQQLTDASHRVISDLNGHTRQIIALQDSLNTAIKEFRGIADAYDKATTSTINQLSHGFKTTEDNLGSLLRAHREEMVRVERQLEAMARGLEGLSGRLDPRLLPKEEWSAVVEKLTEISSSNAAFTAPLSGISGALNGIQMHLAQEDGRIRGDLSEILKGMGDVLNLLRRLEVRAGAPNTPDILTELPSGPDT
ncbi:Chromosome partition protein Smc [Calidithermus terrae]|uniref:Chromosome partition protein Smc n=1 Tax=Calidithermus terrae TaxID=1408545 RepID=A0A399F5D8_9DEIN|nr:hypothetical protein [Calidithermus terrae]RIH90975.1 Chromosome partition protein Smc [Calidithermus terrae]